MKFLKFFALAAIALVLLGAVAFANNDVTEQPNSVEQTGTEGGEGDGEQPTTTPEVTAESEKVEELTEEVEKDLAESEGTGAGGEEPAPTGEQEKTEQINQEQQQKKEKEQQTGGDDDDENTKTVEREILGKVRKVTLEKRVAKIGDVELVRWVEKLDPSKEDPNCKGKFILVIDSSGSMREEIVDNLMAASTATDTWRAHDGEVMTLLFSTKVQLWRDDHKAHKKPRGKSTWSDGCTFCWKKSNADVIMFPKPREFKAGGNTNLLKAIYQAFAEVDAVHEAAKAAGKPLDKPVKVVVMSDLLQTESTSSAEVKSFQNLVMSYTCGKKWNKYLKFDKKTGQLERKKFKNKNKPVCDEIPRAELTYILNSNNNKLHPMSKDGFVDNSAVIDTLWENNLKNDKGRSGLKKFGLGKGGKRVRKRLRREEAAMKIFRLLASASTAEPSIKTTVGVFFKSNKHKEPINIQKMASAITGDTCNPLYSEMDYNTKKFVLPEVLPPVPVELAPGVVYYANDVRKVDPKYKPVDSDQTISVGLLSEALEKVQTVYTGYVERVEAVLSSIEAHQKSLEEAHKTASASGEELAKRATDAARRDFETKAAELRKAVLAEAKTVLAEAKALYENFDKFYVGGFASVRGRDGYNIPLSTDRSLNGVCMLDEVMKEFMAGKPYSVSVGFFGSRAHCLEIAAAIGEASLKCETGEDRHAARDRMEAWRKESEENERIAHSLEDGARRTETFMRKPPADSGFEAKCCVAFHGAECPEGLEVCPRWTESPNRCSSGEWKLGELPKAAGSDMDILKSEGARAKALHTELMTFFSSNGEKFAGSK